MAQPAEAKIVYRSVWKNIGGHPIYIDFEGLNLFKLRVLSSNRTNVMQVAAVHSGIAVAGGPRYASELAWRTKIGSNDRFSQSSMSWREMIGASCTATMSHTQRCFVHGLWGAGGTGGYLGLKFTLNGKLHYGWARVRVDSVQGFYITGVLTGYAYETIPNKAIKAGQTKGPDVVTLEPGSLGALAAGRSGRK